MRSVFLRYILSEGHLWSKRGHFSSKNGERAREVPLGGGFLGGFLKGTKRPALNRGGGGRGPGMGRIGVLVGFLGVHLINGGSGGYRVGYGMVWEGIYG